MLSRTLSVGAVLYLTTYCLTWNIYIFLFFNFHTMKSRIRGYYVSILQKLTGYRWIPCQEWVSPQGTTIIDALLVAKPRKLLLLWTCILVMNVENTVSMARKNVDGTTSQCPQKTRKGICEYPASFAAHWPIKLCVTNRVH